MSNSILPLLGGVNIIPSGFASNIQEQIRLISADFRQTYFGLVGSTVQSWYNVNEGIERFQEESFGQQREYLQMVRMQDRVLRHELAGQTEGIGNILALRLASHYGFDPHYMSRDIGDAVDSILYGSVGSLLHGVRKLGYWSGFSRALTY